jgi:hypothetical protein
MGKRVPGVYVPVPIGIDTADTFPDHFQIGYDFGCEGRLGKTKDQCGGHYDPYGSNVGYCWNSYAQWLFIFTVPDDTDDIIEVIIKFRTAVTPPEFGEAGAIVQNRARIYGSQVDYEKDVLVDPADPPGDYPTAEKSSRFVELEPARPAQPAQYGLEYTVTYTVPAGNRGNRIYLMDILTGDFYRPVDFTNRHIDIRNVEFKVEIDDPAGSPDFAYNLVKAPNGVINRWVLYFGASNATAVTTAWQYDDGPRTVTIPNKRRNRRHSQDNSGFLDKQRKQAR